MVSRIRPIGVKKRGAREKSRVILLLAPPVRFDIGQREGNSGQVPWRDAYIYSAVCEDTCESYELHTENELDGRPRRDVMGTTRVRGVAATKNAGLKIVPSACEAYSSPCGVLPAVERHCSSTSRSAGFSSAAATRSLSLSCLFTKRMMQSTSASAHHNTSRIVVRCSRACSLWWEPRFDADIDLEPLWQAAEETHADGQPYPAVGQSCLERHKESKVKIYR